MHWRLAVAKGCGTRTAHGTEHSHRRRNCDPFPLPAFGPLPSGLAGDADADADADADSAADADETPRPVAVARMSIAVDFLMGLAGGFGL